MMINDGNIYDSRGLEGRYMDEASQHDEDDDDDGLRAHDHLVCLYEVVADYWARR